MATPEQFEAFFREADTDDDGFLTFEELVGVLRKHDYPGDEDAIRAFFNEVDTSEDGLISFDEYMIAMGQVPPKVHSSQALVLRIFHEFDRDGNGVITVDELQEVFAELGRHMDEDEVARIMEMIDQDGSGSVNYQEFAEGLFGEGQ